MNLLKDNIKYIKNKFSKTDTVFFNIVTLVGGSACAQIFTIITSPLITRLYSPEDFGVLAVFSSIYMMLLTIITLKFDAAIPLETDKIKAKRLLIVSFYAVIIFSFIIALLLVILVKCCHLFNSSYIKYFWVLPLGLIGSGLYTIFSSWFLRSKEYYILTKTRVWQSFSSVLVQIVLGVTNIGAWGLLISSLVAQTNGIGVLIKKARKDFAIEDFIIGFKNIFIILKEYYRYPLFIVWTSLMNVAGQQAPPLILSTYLSTGVTGLYSLGMRVVQSPITLISSSVSSVFISRAKDENQKGTLEKFSIKILKNMIIISVIPFSIFFVFGPELFSLVFGLKWKTAGIYVQLMTPWLFALFSASPLTSIVLVKGQQYKEFIWQIVIIITRILSLFIGVLYFDDIQTIAIYGISSFIVSVSYFIWMFSLINISLLKLIKILHKEIIIIFCNLLILLLGKWVCGDTLSIIIFLLIYITISCCLIFATWRENENSSI
jgi:O-antigen/teichoic acid export membrane protein